MASIAPVAREVLVRTMGLVPSATTAPLGGSTLRDRLVIAAIEFTTTKGWAALTMTKLADRVGVSRQTVYNELGAKPQLADDMDVVIFDDFTPETVPLPPTSLLYFHPTGPHSPFPIAHTLPNPRITEIDENHPVMRWLTLSCANPMSPSIGKPPSIWAAA